MSASKQEWTVYPAPIKAVLQTADHFGVDSANLLSQAGVDITSLHDSGSRIPVDKFYRLYELAIDASDNPDFAIAVGRIVFLSGLNLQLYMTTICNTFRDYLKLMPSVLKLRGDIGEAVTHAEGDSICLQWRPLQNDTASKRYLSDEIMTASALIINSLCVSPVTITQTHFSYSKPLNIKGLEAIFGKNIKFNQEHTCLYFDRKSLSFPLVKPDYGNYSDATNTFQCLFDTPNAQDIFLDSLRKSIVHSLPTGSVGIDLIAGHLNVSRRTLQRRLSDRDTNFQQVLQQVRSTMAIKYLGDNRLAVTEIAFLLGYTDQASFSSAFKSWYGKPPSEYRH